MVFKKLSHILKNCADDRPGIVIYSVCKAMGYFDIKFFPMYRKDFERFMKNECTTQIQI